MAYIPVVATEFENRSIKNSYKITTSHRKEGLEPVTERPVMTYIK